jgi:hypothetical protein
LAEMGEALKHHYEHNPHHPEHHRRGVLDMTLIDLLEMLADWKASGERTDNGSMVSSLRHNAVRFNIPDVVMRMLWNTCRSLDWLDRPECGEPYPGQDEHPGLPRMFCDVPVGRDGRHPGNHETHLRTARVPGELSISPQAPQKWGPGYDHDQPVSGQGHSV